MQPVVIYVEVDGVSDSSFAGINFDGVLPVETIAKGLDIAYDAVANTIVGDRLCQPAQPAPPGIRHRPDRSQWRHRCEFATSFGTIVDRRVPDGRLQPGPRTDLAQDVVLLADGRVVVAGTTASGTTTEIGLVRLLTEEPPTISIGDVTVTEGDSGTVNAVFTVSLSDDVQGADHGQRLHGRRRRHRRDGLRRPAPRRP